MMQRRQFLAAAATLAMLPQPASAGAQTAAEVVEDRSVTDDGSYSISDCGSVPGGLTDVCVASDMNDGPLQVKGVHEDNGWSGVSLRWESGAIEVGTQLEPDVARDLARRLEVAADAAEGEIIEP
jgi:hypothetical protein